ncbi:O-antigen polymerase [Providencia stuartii]|uniref:O-antigen polymerase n=1 Tax=Providencia stuartii TaxID=588 RepID=UPI0034E4A967
MFKLDFINFYYDNIVIGVICLLISFLVTYLLIRKQIYSIFEPMFFFSILGASAYSVVLLLWIKDEISNYYFIGFIITQLAFFGGWRLIKPKKLKEQGILYIDAYAIILYYLSSFIFVITQLIVYKMMGLPMFMDSRLNAFAGGGGVGVLDRFIYVSSIIAFTFSSYRLLFIKNYSTLAKYFDILIFLFFCFTKLVSGSKLGILDCVFIIGLLLVYSRRIIGINIIEKKIKKKLYVLIIISIPLSFITIYIQSLTNQNTDIFSSLLLRFVNTGDIYYLSWVKNYINNIPNNDGGLALFSDFIRTFRLLPKEELPQHLGLSVFLFHTTTDNIIGPNARVNVFGLHYFGLIGALVYSFILGVILGLIRNKLLIKSPLRMSYMIFFVLLAYSATYIEQDFNSMFLKYILNIIIYYSIFGLSCLFITKIVKKHSVT